MHRHAARTVTALSLAALLAGAALPAQAKSRRAEQRGGKKPIAEIVSFDAATSALVLDLADGEDLTLTVDPDAQVKLEHRGKSRKGSKSDKSSGRGNPSNGSLEDLVAGALVLRLKIEDEALTKIRLRPAPAEAPAETPAETPDDGDDETEGSGDDETETDATEDDSDDDSADAAPDDLDPEDDVDTPDDGE